MLNRIVLMGRIVRNPELRHATTGTEVANFTLAVDRDFKGPDSREADFIDCVAWGHTATFIERFFTKGRMAVVSGRLQIRAWTDKQGNKRNSAEVVADSVYFRASKREAAPAAAPEQFEELDDTGEPLPF